MGVIILQKQNKIHAFVFSIFMISDHYNNGPIAYKIQIRRIGTNF